MYDLFFFSQVYIYRPTGLFLLLQMARAYIFTKNNYTEEDEERLRQCIGKARITYIIWGREIAPTTGTPHLQGYMQSNEKMKERIHKATGLFVEIARASYEENRCNYCAKDGDWEEHGIPNKEHAGHGQGRRTDLAGVKKSIEQGLSYDEICDLHFEEAAKYNRFISEQVSRHALRRGLGSLQEAYASASLRPWQTALMDILVDPPCPRKILWFWEDKGNIGKSWMTTYLMVMKKACVIDLGKLGDMIYLYSKNPSNIVIFDIPRTSEEHMHGAYTLAERLKNGRLSSFKYESQTIVPMACHVIFFANFAPDMTKWSQDRYFIKKL